ncbi:hypothetical protein KBA73_02695 [Patescibacteria group bacterium]|nr:hypothetical protein [Patescibacteria group bacterium]
MPNHLAQGLLSAITAREEKDGAPAAKLRAAQQWAKERVEQLPKDIASTHSAFRIKLVPLWRNELCEDDLLKIKVLNELLGVDLMPREGGTEIFNCHLGDDRDDWHVAITADRLRKLLEVS